MVLRTRVAGAGGAPVSGRGWALAATLATIASGLLAACAEPLITQGPDTVDTLPAVPVAPASNPITEEKRTLGRLLFWDPVLSAERDVSCASCHDPAFGYADGRPLAVGTGGAVVARNAPTVLHTGWNGLRGSAVAGFDADISPMFWDNRTLGLEAQASGPLRAASEMRGPHLADTDVERELVGRLSALPGYVAAFEAAFGPGPITEARITMALATFQRTLSPGTSAFDRFMQGEDTALSIAQKRGFIGFFEAGCGNCHGGPMFSDFGLHRLGAGAHGGRLDQGDGQRRFRTPTLRNVARTAPYMHDGSLATLDEVYDFYVDVDRSADPALESIGPVIGTAREDMTAFLQALSDEIVDDVVPESVPSGLAVGGTRRAGR